jgi:protein-tyrosine-phosphatase
MFAKKFMPVLLTVFLIITACKNQSTDEKSIQMKNPTLQAGLQQYISDIERGFEQIPEDRRKTLKELADYIDTQDAAGEPKNLIFICTHNSRRSHMSQLWAQTAAHYYGIEDVHSYSGGTEATAFNPRAVHALRKAGFEIEQTDSSSNPVYLVKYSEGAEPVKGFSKKYDDAFNPKEHFAAVMTCSQADEACPIVYGATRRISIPYEDPKVADNTPEEEARYDERCRQIATELFYAFSLIR